MSDVWEVPDALRSRLVLALDVDDLVAARRLARELKPWFGTVKVGLELFSAAGPEAITTLRDQGFDVFYDAKLHDIPATIHRTGRVLGALGASYVTLHTAGGVAMLRAGVEGLREGAASGDEPSPMGLGVTVLTSDAEASSRVLHQRVAAALEAGCGGVVCAAPDIPAVREIAPAATIVTPGIRPPGSPSDDQSRVATPAQALAANANMLVIGRVVTRAERPVAAARALVEPLMPTFA
jgi:orotidine-5'-phosphate decarboxylase